jgi:hypothetical protein
MKNLFDEFDKAIREAIRESYAIGYPPTRIEQMITQSHPVAVAKKLVTSSELQTGFQAVINMGRGDITFEAIMLKDEFKTLFTKEELEAAKWRLQMSKNV